MDTSSKTRVERRSETSWIKFLSDLWGASGAEVDLGDDACVLPAGRYSVTADALVEGVDFERGWGPPAALGHKALAANLSDLAAMGARPRFMLLTLGIPEGIEDAWVEEMLAGMRALAGAEGAGLCGGDLTASPAGLSLSLTLIGAQEHPPLRRSGGKPGDLLFVGGRLGGARAALAAFKGGARLSSFPSEGLFEGADGLLDRFYRPPSQTGLGLFLAGEGLATSCIDLSDGLSADLRRLCEASRCGAEIEVSALPIDPMLSLAGVAGESPLKSALLGGEDQVLLFSASPGTGEKIRKGPFPVFPIGRMNEASEGVRLLNADGSSSPLPRGGYDHFSR